MKAEFWKRLLSGFLAVLMVVSNMPVMAFASAEDGLCAHHASHEDCGYREAVKGADCTHECDEACYRSVTDCVHTHGDCGYVAAVAEVPCDHVCSDCGYVKAVPGTPCDHVHGDCGYAEAVPGSDCDHVCGDCGYAEAVPGIDCDHDCGDECADGCSHSCDDGSCAYAEAIPGSDCDHDCGDGTCAYSEGTPGSDCSHDCDDGTCAYSEGTPGSDCTHDCGDGTCSYDPGSGEIPCEHECTEDSGCITEVKDCHHEHDGDCGYVKAVSASPCDYVCKVCYIQGLIDALPGSVTADSAEKVQAALDQIDTFAATMTEEELAQVDMTRYEEAEEALAELTVRESERQEAEEAAEELRQAVKELPSVVQLHAMNNAGLEDAYARSQDAYEVYMDLSEEQQALLSAELEILETLLSEFAQLKDLDYVITKSYGANSQIGSAAKAEELWPYAGTRFYLKQSVDGVTYSSYVTEDTAVDGKYWLNAWKNNYSYIYLEPAMDQPGYYYAYTKASDGTYVYLKSGGYGDYIAVETTQYNYVWNLVKVNGVLTLMLHKDWGDYYATYNNGYWYLEESPSAYATVVTASNHSSHSYTAKATAGSCTSGGYTTHTCDTCGLRYWTDFTEDSGHSYDSATIDWAEDLLSAEVTLTCSSCGDTKTETKTATVEVITPATCTAAGENQYTVSIVYADKTETLYNYGPIAPRGHDMSSDGACVNCDFIGGTFGDGLSWEYSNDTGIVTVSGSGAMPDFKNPSTSDSGLSPWYYQTVRGVVIEEGITSVGAYAFAKEPVSSVELPFSVKSIGNYAFGDCAQLTAVELPQDLYSIGDGAFSNTGLSALVIPETVAVIGKHAFAGSKLNSVVVSPWVETIEEYAFYNCPNLTYVELGEGTKTVGDMAFQRCFALETVLLPQGLTAIGKQAFAECYALKQIDLPESLTSIGYNGFAISGLTSVEIPAGVTVLEYGAFADCEALTSVTLHNTLKTVEAVAFRDTALTKVHFYGTQAQWEAIAVEENGNEPLFQAAVEYHSLCGDNHSFENGTCTGCGAVAVVITVQPGSVTAKVNDTISFRVTAEGDGLSYAWYVKNADKAEYDLLTGLNSYVYTTTMTAAMDGRNIYCVVTDQYCNEATSDVVTVTLDPTVGGSCGENVTWTLDKTTGILTISGEGPMADYTGNTGMPWYNYLSSVKEVIIEAGVTTVGARTFRNFTGITSVTLPDSITSIGAGSFYNCRGLTEFTIPAGVTEIKAGTFCGCENITAIWVPDGVTSILENGFSFCKGLKEILLPASLTYIEFDAFADAGLTDIYFKGTEAQWNSIEIGNYNDPVHNATVHFNVTAPCYGMHTEEVIPGTTGTCQTPGLTEGSKCSVCGETLVKQEEYLGDHTLENGICTVCKVSGTCGENLKWTYDDGLLTISGTGTMYDYSEGTAPWNSFRGSITKVVVESGVTTVGKHAFYACTKLEEVSIADTVSEIGSSAFENCVGLVTVKLPSGLKCISSSMFRGCSALVSVDIPDAVTEIDSDAFRGCTKLTNVDLPDGLKVIGGGAFYDCSHLAELELPAGLTEIGGHAFNGCSALTSMAIPSGVTELNSGVFANCSLLESVELPDGLTIIENMAFWYCDQLKDISIPADVVSIGDRAFYACSSLESVEIPAGVTEISDELFYVCRKLQSVTLPQGLTSIGTAAFYGCSSLEDVEIPATVREIGAGAFSSCESLKSITVPEGVKVLQDSVFSGCAAVVDVSLPQSLEEIGANVFDRCTSLTVVKVPDHVRSIGDRVFSECSNLVRVELPDGLTSIGDHAFEYCKNLVYVNLPVTVSSVGNGVFFGCKALTAITLPEGITEIPDDFFNGCSALTDVIIPSTVTSIGSNAFRSCSSLKSLTIPAGVTAIGDTAFEECTSLASIAFPESLNSIGTKAFYRCVQLNTITFTGDAPAIGTNAFEKVTATAYYLSSANGWTADVKQNYGGTITWKGSSSQGICGDNVRWVFEEDTKSLLIYGSGPMYDFVGSPYHEVPWKSFRDQIEVAVVKNGITTLGGYAFSQCANLYEVTLPEGITSIGERAFNQCGELMEIQLPSTVRTIGSNAFDGCALITSLVIPEGVTAIPGNMASNCTRLETVTIPETVTSIGSWAFAYNSSLIEVILPAGLKELGSYAFYHCQRITQVEIPGGVETIGDSAFSGCEALTQVKLNPGTKVIGDHAFAYNDKLASVNLPEGITTIGEYAFGSACLTEVTLPSTLTSLGARAFIYTDIQEIVIPEGIKRIFAETFRNCNSLRSVVIPASVRYIDESAFQMGYHNGCTITFLGSAPSFVYNCFKDADMVCYYPYGDSTWTASKMQNYEGSSVIWCPYGTAGENVSWKLNEEGTLILSGSGEIPDYEVSAPWSGFADRVRTVDIGEGITAIGTNAFTGCGSLTSIRFLGDAPAIAENAFTGVTANAVVYSDDPDWAEVSGKNYGGRLTWVEQGTGVTSGTANGGMHWTLSEDGVLFVYGEGVVDNYETYANWDKTLVRRAVFAEGINYIPSGAFRNSTNLESVTIPSTATSIHSEAFYGCTALKEIHLSEGLTSIGRQAFENCTGLERITLPESLTSISWGAFQYCAGIESVTIPASVVSIGQQAFYMCTGMEKVLFEGSAPQNLATYARDYFSGTYCVAYYPAGDASWTEEVRNCLGEYLTWIPYNTTGENILWNFDSATGSLTVFGEGALDAAAGAGWAGVASQVRSITVGEGITAVSGNALSQCVNAENVFFEGNAPAMDSDAFAGITARIFYPDRNQTWQNAVGNYGGSLTWLSFNGMLDSGSCGENLSWVLDKGGLLYIYGTGQMTDYDYYGSGLSPWNKYNNSIKKVTMMEGLTSIGAHAFMGCGMTSVVIPDGVTTIGTDSFFECTSLKSVKLSDSVTNLLGENFYGCTALEEVILSENLERIGSSAFSGCSSLTSIRIPASVSYLGHYSFGKCTALTEITFEGDAPVVETVSWSDQIGAFIGVTAVANYPSGHTSWTREAMESIGGNLTWKPYCLDAHEEEILPGKAATCTEDGITEGVRCTVCETVLVEQEVILAAHKYEDGFCTFCGLLEGDLGEGLTAVFDEDSGVLTISGTGPMKDFADYTETPWYALRNSINTVVVENGVTTVGTAAFKNLEAMASAVVAEGVTSIGADAFNNCSMMWKVVLPESVTQIGRSAFGGCMSLNKVNIPSGIKVLSANVFASCVSLKEIQLPEGITTIEDGAFNNCDKLTSLVIPASVTSIDANAISECGKLETVTFLGSAPDIAANAFYGVTTNACYPGDDTSWNEQTKIGYGGTLTWLPNACSGGHTDVVDPGFDATCTEDGLTEGKHCSVCDTVLVKQEVIPAGHNVEAGICTRCLAYGTCGENLTWTLVNSTLTVTGTGPMDNFTKSPWYSVRNQITAVIMEAGITSVGDYAFKDCEKLVSAQVPNNVTYIGISAFENCIKLTSAPIPAKVTDIQMNAFCNCSSIQSVEIPEGIIYIADGLFEGCYGLESVALPRNLKDICSNAFRYCIGLTEITVPASVDAISDEAFFGCTSLVRAELSEGLTTLGGKVFFGCENLVYITIPSTVTFIGSNTFEGCKSLTSIELPEGLDYVATNVFKDCTGLTSVKLPSTVTKIDSYAFVDCSSLTAVNIPSGVTEIGYGAFSGCSALQTVSFPESLTTLGNYALSGCSVIDYISFTGDAPSIGANAFSGVDAIAYYLSSNATWTDEKQLNYGGTITWKGSANQGYAGPNVRWVYEEETKELIIYGSGPMDDFNFTSVSVSIPWVAFNSDIQYVTVKSGVTTVGDLAFYQCRNLYEIKLPEGITKIGQYAFQECEELMEVKLPDTVQSIGTNAFNGCSTMLYLDIPEGVTEIPDYMCYGCSRMEYVTIPETVESIGDYAFAHCSSLTELILPSNLNAIESHAFYGCGRIKEVDIPGSVAVISDGVFHDCDSLKKVTMHEGTTQIGAAAFSYSDKLEEVILPDGLKTIAEYAFEYTALKKLDIPETVTTIMADAFCGTALEEIVIPNTIRRIYENTFQYCYSLRSVTVPASVKLIDAYVFHGLNNCEITFLGSAPSFFYNSFASSDLVCYYPYGDSSWTASKLQSYEGSNVVWCPYGSLEGDIRWKIDVNGVLTVSGSGSISDFETKAPWAAFSNRIRYAVIEEGVTAIGANAFTGCGSLKVIEFLGNAPSIADNAFTGVSSSVLYSIPDSGWDNVSGKNYGGSLTWIDCTNETASGTEGHNIFWTLNSNGLLVIYGSGKMDAHGNSYGWMKNEAMKMSVREVVILEGVTGIGYRAFDGCGNLTSVSIPSTVTEISEYAFYNCESLEAIDFPAALTYIGFAAFYQCYKLHSVTIPASVTTIGYMAFHLCELKTVIFEGSAYDTFESGIFYYSETTDGYYPAGDASWTQEVRNRLGGIFNWIPYNVAADSVMWSFDQTTGTLNIFGQGVVDENVAVAWANVAASARTVVIRDGITAISANAMSRCSNAKYIFFDGSAPSIDAAAFSGMTATVFYPDRDQTWQNATGNYGGQLTWYPFNGMVASGICGDDLYWAIDRAEHLYVYGSGDMADYQHSDGKYAPWYGKKFRKVTMLEDLTSIGTYAFAYNDLTEVVIPDGVAVIRNDAFRNCQYLTSVTIPGTVKSLETQCFENCYGLAELTLRDGVESIGWNVFMDCRALTELTIPASIKSIGYQAFSGCTGLYKITFLGDAPELHQMSWSDGKAIFDGVTATAYYPANNATWTRTVMQTYGGNLTWICEACKNGHVMVDGVCSGCGMETVRIIRQPESVTVAENQLFSFSVEAAGDGLVYTWYTIPVGDTQFEVWAHGATIENWMSEGCDGQLYYCIITDAYGNSVKTDTVTVSLAKKLVITQQPVDVWADYGANAIVSLKAEGEGLTYQWYVFDQKAGEYRLDDAFHGSSYSLRMDENTNGTIVYCVITDRYGQSVQSNCAWMHVTSKALVATVDQSQARVKAGETAKVIVNAEGDGQLRYEWYWQAPGADEWHLTEAFKGNTYSVEMDESRNGRMVYCMVYDVWGSSWQTETVTLSMIEERTELKIVSQPKSVTVAAGVKAITTVKAQGDGLTYNWFYKDRNMESFIHTASFKGASYSVEMNAARNGRQVYCEIMDKYGNLAYSEVATLSMIGVTITRQPVSVKAFEGETAKVSFEAQGEGLTYTWYYKEAGSSKFYKTTAFTGNTYSVAMNAARDGRQVYCVVTDKHGNTVATNTVTLSLLDKIQSGECGEFGYMTWELDTSTGVLTIADIGRGDEYMGDWEPIEQTVNPWYAFRQYIKTVVIKGKVRNIGEGAFYGCCNLIDVTMPDTVGSIGRRAFSGCSSLESITISASVKYVHEWAFEDCESLDTVIFRGSAPSLSDSSFAGSSPFAAYYTDDGSWNGRLKNYGTEITWKEMQELKILSQPKSVSAVAGAKATVTLKAQGDGLSYAWYFKDAGASKFSLTTSFKGTSYSVGMTAARNGRQVYCVVSDQYGNSVKSATATLSVAAAELKITKQPVSVTVASGATAKVTFTAEGEGLTYAWYFRNKGASKFSLTTSFTGNTYSTKMDGTRNGREVYCVVTDQYGNSVTTNTVTMSMASSVKITKQPVSVTVASGATAKVTFTAEGEGLTYAWYFKNKGASKFTLTTSFTGNSYSTKMDASRDGRQIYCVVTDQYGNSVTTNTVTLSMASSVKITKQPVSVTVASGATAKVTFTAEGEGLTYAWYFRNKGASKFSLTTSFTGNSYSTKMDGTRDGRQLYCVVTDQYGNSVTTNTVTLSMASSVKITKQPVSVTVASGATAKIGFEAQGEGLTYAWYFKNKGASKFTLTTSFTGNTYSTKMDSSRNGRQVYCVVTDKYGNSVTTNTVTMTMASGLKITKQPASVTVANGATAKISFTAEGEGLTYAWYFKNKGASKFTLTTSFTGNTYSTKMDGTRDGRQVYCVVTDQYGNTVQTNTVTLSMTGSVRILQQPQSVMVKEGEKATVTVQAEGVGLTYQWYFAEHDSDDFLLTNSFKSNSYYVQMNGNRDGRRVYCVVSDSSGNSVQTDTVRLTMQIPLEVNMVDVVDDDYGTDIYIDACGSGLSYRWYVKESGSSQFVLSDVSGSTYHISRVEARDGCELYCVITDDYGETYTTETVTVNRPAQELYVQDVLVSNAVWEGDKTWVDVYATGDALTYQWYYKDPGSETFVLDPTCTDYLYYITMGEYCNGREVYCVVTDGYGASGRTNTAIIVMRGTSLAEKTAMVTQQKKVYSAPSYSADQIGFLDRYAYFTVERTESVNDFNWGYITGPVSGWIDMEYVESLN